MKILVCGGRDFGDYALLDEVLTEIHKETPITHIVTGAQRAEPKDNVFIGADWIGIEWALKEEINFSGLPAKWGKYQRAAGPRRNAEMLMAHPDIQLVVAFKGGRGTADMVRQAKDWENGIPVRIIE